MNCYNCNKNIEDEPYSILLCEKCHSEGWRIDETNNMKPVKLTLEELKAEKTWSASINEGERRTI